MSKFVRVLNRFLIVTYSPSVVYIYLCQQGFHSSRLFYLQMWYISASDYYYDWMYYDGAIIVSQFLCFQLTPAFSMCLPVGKGLRKNLIYTRSWAFVSGHWWASGRVSVYTVCALTRITLFIYRRSELLLQILIKEAGLCIYNIYSCGQAWALVCTQAFFLWMSACGSLLWASPKKAFNFFCLTMFLSWSFPLLNCLPITFRASTSGWWTVLSGYSQPLTWPWGVCSGKPKPEVILWK